MPSIIKVYIFKLHIKINQLFINEQSIVKKNKIKLSLRKELNLTKLETLTFFAIVMSDISCGKSIITIQCCHHSRSSKRKNNVAPGSRCHSNGGLFTRRSEFESRFRNRVVKQSRPVKYGISAREIAGRSRVAILTFRASR